MAELYDRDGNAVAGALTPEEFETQKDEVVKAATEPLQKELDQAKQDLAKAGDKDHNFAQLRERVERAETQIASAKTDALKEFEQTQSTRTADSFIKKLADGDEELEKKIRLQYNRLGDEAKTPEEIAKKVRDAWSLSHTEDVPDPLTGAFSSGGADPVMPPRPQAGKPPLSENQKAFLRTYGGMTDEELNHYALKVHRLKNPQASLRTES